MMSPMPAVAPSTAADPPPNLSSPSATLPNGPGSPAAWKASVRRPSCAILMPRPAPGPPCVSRVRSAAFARAMPIATPESLHSVRMIASKAMLVFQRGGELFGHGGDRGAPVGRSLNRFAQVRQVVGERTWHPLQHSLHAPARAHTDDTGEHCRAEFLEFGGVVKHRRARRAS